VDPVHLVLQIVNFLLLVVGLPVAVAVGILYLVDRRRARG
jgi:hypothetical protein